MRGEIGQQDFKGFSGRDIVDRVHKPTILLSHDLLLGICHDDSLENERYTDTVLCEVSEGDWASKTDLLQLNRIFLSLIIFSAIGYLLHTRIVRSPGIRAGTPTQDKEGVPCELNLSSDAPDGLGVAVGKLRPQKNLTRNVVHHVE